MKVTNAGGTTTLTSVERLKFSDRVEAAALPTFQPAQNTLSTSVGGTALSVQQVPISDITDPTRGTLSSKVQVNGQDISGVPATLKKGWKVGTTADVNGDGTPELFFFGVDTVNGLGSGYGATWSLNASGAVTNTKVHLQMQRQDWEVAGASDVNGIKGDEIIWQNTLTGDKAIWTDANGDGALEGGFVISGLGTSTAQRIVGTSDLDKDGLKEFLLFNDATNVLSLYEATPLSSGSISASLANSFNSFSDFQTAATAAGASYTVFSVVS